MADDKVTEINVNMGPSNEELKSMLEQVALYCDELKAEIERLRSDLALHEHGAGGRCMIPVQK